jgi:hypothetical protein
VMASPRCRTASTWAPHASPTLNASSSAPCTPFSDDRWLADAAFSFGRARALTEKPRRRRRSVKR